MITLDWSALNGALKTVVPVAAKGGTLPVYAGVRITPSERGIELCCTDGDLTMTANVEAIIFNDLPPVVVPARLFASFVGTLRGDVQLAVEDHDLIVSSGKTSLTLRTMPAEDFPQIATADAAPIALSDDTRARLSHILFAASKDSARPVLCGVGFGDGHAVCTDSYRLAAASGTTDMPKVIIPARALEMALKLGASILSVSDRLATFASDSVTITTRLIEGQFPNWQSLVPASTPQRIVVDRDMLAAAIDRVGVLVQRDEPIRFTADDGGLCLSVRSRDVGEATETVAADVEFEGTVAFNGRFVADMLRALDESKVEIGLVDSMKPAVVRSGGLVALLMPVRVS